MEIPLGLQDEAPCPTPTTRKPTGALLPAFEPLSSSPALPRPLKRTRDVLEETRVYPTPVPTSSTAILTSSPPKTNGARPTVQRTVSTLSERAPLSAVPTIILNPDGKPIFLGRSSVSCDYQLSGNRLISRVHVELAYQPALSRLDRDRVKISCLGWNGVKIHCQSKVFELKKGESFTLDLREEEIMLDVHDSRVVVQWPEKPHLGPSSSDEDEDTGSPTKKQRAMRRHSTPPSPSPVQSRRRAPSPISPSPAVQALLPSSPPLLQGREAASVVEIYEDPVPSSDEPSQAGLTQLSQQVTQILTQNIETEVKATDQSTEESEEFSDQDEENDPVIHSFGPFGANILPRLAAFKAAESPLRKSPPSKTSRSILTEPLKPTDSPPQPHTTSGDPDVRGHIINQLAFSRLSSTPLSTIFNHLPHDSGIESKEELSCLIKDTECIGEVRRAGKDAAGQPLESEYYYIPERDDDVMRKEAVVHDLRKPGLRACRKQHKQYFWRKPK